MPKLHILGFGEFAVETGKKLVLAIEDSGVNILHRCGGKGKCTTCRVEILEGDYTETSPQKALDSKYFIDDQLRLSCQLRIAGDLKIRTIKTVENSGLEAGPRPLGQ
ncbi:2Fe-2S iron-sulfur cluster-binding protein [Peribacillus kribbensis]|uniref:2Fe-2S iron-sulfur cluster-binding protein n=1 Tax=Peribacillus kribbensis TaxID=356658 RepID=UPI0004164BD1|nr:2Fe-2S iron-sulfur cluster-binding protein [Peribacillus kribbensis]